jgi:hypothetical protein
MPHLTFAYYLLFHYKNISEINRLLKDKAYKHHQSIAKAAVAIAGVSYGTMHTIFWTNTCKE